MKKDCFGLFFISVAALLFELAVIRVFSVALWYHFAFMIVSIALFGIAAAGSFLYFKKLSVRSASLLFPISLLLGFFLANELVFDPYKALISPSHVLVLSAYYFLLALPFFFFGTITVSLFIRYKKKAGTLYFWNLLGSALGSVCILIFTPLLGERVIAFSAFIGAVATFFFIRKKTISIGIVAITAILLIAPLHINISEYKELNQALRYPDAELLSTKWGPVSRIDVVNSSFTRYAPGLSLSFQENLPEQLGLLTDAASMSALTLTEEIDFAKHIPTAAAFYLVDNASVLIIKPRAGPDILTAKFFNATITVIENDANFVSVVKDYNPSLYDKVIIRSGRGVRGKYDVIIISITGNVQSNIYSLSDDFLLTKEAFEEYYSHLSDKGVLIVTRWLNFPPRDTLKLASLGLTTGTKEKMVLFRTGVTVTLIVGKDGFDAEKLSSLHRFFDENNFDIVHSPANFTPNKYARFREPYYYNAVQHLLRNEGFSKEYLFEISAPTDEKPFYSNFFKWRSLPKLRNISTWQPFFDSGFLLLFLLLQSILLSTVFILLPVIKRRSLPFSLLSYFFFIGTAYIAVEIVLINKLTLLLGDIMLAAALTIAPLLLFSSIGALLSQRAKPRILYIILPTLSFILLIYAFFISNIIRYFISFETATKIILAIALLAGIGILMGFPFPLAIRAIKQDTAWAFAANGTASVIGAILGFFLAASLGYSTVLIFTAAAYFIALLFLLKVQI